MVCSKLRYRLADFPGFFIQLVAHGLYIFIGEYILLLKLNQLLNRPRESNIAGKG